jgi:hypothetical protein
MRKILCTSGLVVLAAAFMPAQAQQPASAPTATSAAAPAESAVPPEIRRALEGMAEALKAISNLEIKADMTSEEVMDSGQKVENSGVLTIVARRPDRLFMEVASERRTRQFFYDGKQMTIFGPKTGYYATVPAPATTAALMKELSDRYDIDTPLADLFIWGASGVKLDKVRSAFDAGPDRIAGELCDHYAFRQEGTDWQIWIRQAGQPLPCRIIIVNTQDPSEPQTAVTFHWSQPQTIADARFQFTPPPNARRIQLMTAATAATANGGQP